MADPKGLVVQEVRSGGATRHLHFPTGLNVRLHDGALEVLDTGGWTVGVFAAGQWMNAIQGNSVYWKSGERTDGPIALIERES